MKDRSAVMKGSNDQSRRSGRWFIATVAAAVLLSACSGSGSGNDQVSDTKLRKVTVMLDWSPNTNHAGMYLAKAKGFYSDAGLDVTFIQPGATSDPNQAVGAGSVDFGVSASEQLVPARAEGVPVISVAGIIQHNTSSLLSLASSQITAPVDLAGHTYGAYGATFEEALIDRLVSCDGGDPDEVTFTQVGDSDYRQGLTSGYFDAVWVFDAWDVIRLRDIDDLDVDLINFADHLDCIPDWYTPILVANAEKAETDPEFVRSFVEATAKGYAAAMNDPEAAGKALLAEADGLDDELVQRSMEYLATHYAQDPTRWGHQDAAVWDRFVDFLTDNAIIPAGFDTDAAWTNDFLPGSD